MTYRIGQKMVCIIESDRWETYHHPAPEKGRIYTISGVDAGVPLSLCFYELEDGYPSYWACGFRPVVENSTDISIFAALLNPKTISKETV